MFVEKEKSEKLKKNLFKVFPPPTNPQMKNFHFSSATFNMLYDNRGLGCNLIHPHSRNFINYSFLPRYAAAAAVNFLFIRLHTEKKKENFPSFTLIVLNLFTLH
jgi:hypothetical protein